MRASILAARMNPDTDTGEPMKPKVWKVKVWCAFHDRWEAGPTHGGVIVASSATSAILGAQWRHRGHKVLVIQ